MQSTPMTSGHEIVRFSLDKFLDSTAAPHCNGLEPACVVHGSARSEAGTARRWPRELHQDARLLLAPPGDIEPGADQEVRFGPLLTDRGIAAHFIAAETTCSGTNLLIRDEI